MRNKIIIGIMGLLLLCDVIAKAEPIIIQISGSVTSGYGSIWGSDVSVGTGFHGTYTYDSALLNTSTWSGRGQYVHNSPYGMDIFLGEFEFKTAPTHTGQFVVSIEDNIPATPTYPNPSDSYSILSFENVPLFNDYTVDGIEWSLRDSTETALSSIALPLTAPILNQWDLNRVFIYGLDNSGNRYTVQGTVTQASLIPEPVTGMLMAIGVLFLQNK